MSHPDGQHLPDVSSTRPAAAGDYASRRSLLKWSAAAGIAAMLPRPGNAQTPPAGPAVIQGAGFYRLALGDAEVFLVSDGGFVLDQPFPLFGANVGEAAVLESLKENFVPPTQLQMHVNTLLVRKSGQTILVDSGTGGRMGKTNGFAIPRLATLGVTPEQIDTVILTHAHGDHYGGLTDENGKNRFPNAELIVNEIEYDFWTKTPDLGKSGVPVEARAQAIEANAAPLKSLPFTRVRVEKEKELRPGIIGVLTDGHTPGHLSLIIDGGGDNQLFFNTDILHHSALMISHPEFHIAFDTDLNRGVEQRKIVLDRLAADRMLVSGSHLPFPAFGHIGKAGEAYQWRPIIWRW